MTTDLFKVSTKANRQAASILMTIMLSIDQIPFLNLCKRLINVMYMKFERKFGMKDLSYGVHKSVI